MNGILEMIRERLPDLSRKDQGIAGFILEHPERMIQMGIKELAEATSASTASISRFCKLFHIGGFADLKMKIAGELALKPVRQTYQDIVAGNSLGAIVSAIEGNHIHSISDTTRLLDYKHLETVLERLARADRIDLYGMATSGIVAADFAQKLIRIGKRSQAFSDPHMQITSASNLCSKDMVFAISYSGETPEIIDSALCAREGGAFIVSLTRYGANPLAEMADIALFTSSLESGMHRGDMASRIAQLHVIDILFMGLLSGQFDEHVPQLERSFQMVTKYRRKKGRA
ncbi:MAG: transcriptional regulator, RpiR family [Paenibacillaceae bacterium]|jgi:DNA-binding MurR/RpiR family transcriptional regulator|nr:transcriptional regulator, RpiR family [Paenibacillaceae bacterium]